MQSDNGANPDGCAKEQPPKKLGATDKILLNIMERSLRREMG
tara:strand:+ start:3833 stop:3958 length:126 start_codon:yes stop_codon:yes gene_type:complete